MDVEIGYWNGGVKYSLHITIATVAAAAAAIMSALEPDVV